jgi:hypothetical protein
MDPTLSFCIGRLDSGLYEYIKFTVLSQKIKNEKRNKYKYKYDYFVSDKFASRQIIKCNVSRRPPFVLPLAADPLLVAAVHLVLSRMTMLPHFV